MKKALIFTAILFLFGSFALAGPFISGELTLPNIVSLTAGFKADGLTVALTDNDLQTSPAVLDFSATWLGYYDWWESLFSLKINGIDLAEGLSTPAIGNLSFSGKETIHVGRLLPGNTDSTIEVGKKAPVIDLWSKVSFEYAPGPSPLLVPTVSFGFYWEP